MSSRRRAERGLRRALPWAVALVLAGCGSWNKPGATPDQLEADKAACGAEAAKAWPPRQMTAPSWPTEADRKCTDIYGQGPCAPLVQPPGASTDLNAGARSAAFDRCLQSRGYRFSSG
ncbi:hypothetical protein [Pseudorhodoferax soli]|uniref:Lipoprotein n=1 Tax=Pseudorhodoferax soli TaxID=545864 RepID=A0A368Y0Y7_9BURK|nr:hypothetical protein [Pseudorhodoferax soli]RCW72467.1 hypothetical protein DES41_10372 [Pseudorhodoferax soli]